MVLLTCSPNEIVQSDCAANLQNIYLQSKVVIIVKILVTASFSKAVLQKSNFCNEKV